jgi:hypothetical protein
MNLRAAETLLRIDTVLRKYWALFATLLWLLIGLLLLMVGDGGLGKFILILGSLIVVPSSIIYILENAYKKYQEYIGRARKALVMHADAAAHDIV